MKKRATKPKSSSAKKQMLEVRTNDAEKQAFKDAAELAGIPLSAWVRERLRQAAIRDLEAVGKRAAFLEHLIGN